MSENNRNLSPIEPESSAADKQSSAEAERYKKALEKIADKSDDEFIMQIVAEALGWSDE